GYGLGLAHDREGLGLDHQINPCGEQIGGKRVAAHAHAGQTMIRREVRLISRMAGRCEPQQEKKKASHPQDSTLSPSEPWIYGFRRRHQTRPAANATWT